MMVFHTAPISHRDDSGRTVVDVSRKSGSPDLGLAFAPSWSLLRPAIALRKIGPPSPADHAAYRLAYLAEMRRSYREQRDKWKALLSLDRAVLTCYCARPSHASHCHRITLAWLLCQLGAVYMGEVRAALAVGVISSPSAPGNPATVRARVQELPEGSIIVHGGSSGTEEAAADEAERQGLQTLCLPMTRRMVRELGEEEARSRRDLWITRASDALL